VKLYLVQHGEAVSEQENPERPLTDSGRRDVTKIARFLKQEDVEIDRLWHSPKRRAVETAEILAEALQIRELCEERKGLTPNDPVEPVFETVQKIRPEDEIESLMIVSHLPFLQRLAALCLEGSPSESPVQFHMGGVVCLERQNQGPWQFVWAVHPELLK
jgi:phosphohistidine phosphatase